MMICAMKIAAINPESPDVHCPMDRATAAHRTPQQRQECIGQTEAFEMHKNAAVLVMHPVCGCCELRCLD